MPVVVDNNELFVKKRLKQDMSKNLEQPGPKFIHIKFPSLGCIRQLLTRRTFDCGSIRGLSTISTKRDHRNKAKLAFILPNFSADKRIGPHNEDILSLLVGTLLGDNHAERAKSGGVRFIFQKSKADKNYIFWLYEFFNKRGYCTNNLPVVCKHAGASYQPVCYRFITYSYTSLIWLYKGFYNHKKQKKVPVNIADLLTPLSLAVWICDNGNFHYPSLRTHIQSFSKKDVRLLSLALETKFNIKSTLCWVCTDFAPAHLTSTTQGNLLLSIKIESMPLLRKLVIPYMEPNMFYKLGL